jgi:hypothetical protein
MQRELATIQKILKIDPIPDADKIEKATILGWEVVVRKGEFSVGDMCVYVEIDSILPADNSNFEFMRVRKYKVKTIKLKKQVSQGIAFPLSILPSGRYRVGDDVTKVLGIRKHDPQAAIEFKMFQRQAGKLEKFFVKYAWYRVLFMTPRINGQFPSFLLKTDEPRIQLFPDICEEHKDTLFVATEKLDGCSATYFLLKNSKKWQFWKPFIFGVCSRNIYLRRETNNHYWKVANEYDIKNKLIKFYKDYGIEIAIQGEIIGEGVQGNKYKLSGHRFFIFNALNIKYGNFRLCPRLTANRLNMDTVPVVNHKFILKDTIHNTVNEAICNSYVCPDVPREGIVIRNEDQSISIKIINPEFLLQYGE